MGGGSINTPRRGLVSLPGGYAGEEKSLSQRIAEMFGSINVGTSGGVIPNTKKFTKSASISDGSTTGGQLLDKNVEKVIPGVYEPTSKEDSDAYTDFRINKPDILSETEIQEKVDLGKSDVSNQPWWMLGFPGGMIDGLGAGEYMKNKAYDCLLYTSPSPRDRQKSRMPSSA